MSRLNPGLAAVLLVGCGERFEHYSKALLLGRVATGMDTAPATNQHNSGDFWDCQRYPFTKNDAGISSRPLQLGAIALPPFYIGVDCHGLEINEIYTRDHLSQQRPPQTLSCVPSSSSTCERACYIRAPISNFRYKFDGTGVVTG